MFYLLVAQIPPVSVYPHPSSLVWSPAAGMALKDRCGGHLLGRVCCPGLVFPACEVVEDTGVSVTDSSASDHHHHWQLQLL